MIAELSFYCTFDKFLKKTIVMSNINASNKQSKTKKDKQNKNTLQICLNAKDILLLERYAKRNNISMKVAAKKIVKQFLTDNVTMPEQVAKNQLDLFSPLQTDIFDYTK